MNAPMSMPRRSEVMIPPATAGRDHCNTLVRGLWGGRGDGRTEREGFLGDRALMAMLGEAVVGLLVEG